MPEGTPPIRYDAARNRTRICYLTGSLDDEALARRLRHLTLALAESHEVTVLCLEGEGEWDPVLRQAGAEVRTLGRLAAWSPCLWPFLRRSFRAHRPDILHVFLDRGVRAAVSAARRTGVPGILLSPTPYAMPSRTGLSSRVRACIDYLVLDSPAAAAPYLTDPDASVIVRVIPDGMEVETPKALIDREEALAWLGLPFEARVVGFAPGRNRANDLTLFFGVAQRLLMEDPNHHFAFIDTVGMRADLDKRLAREGLQGKTMVVCRSPESRVPYAILDVIVAGGPSRFPVIPEAASAGVPIVSLPPHLADLIVEGVTGIAVDNAAPVAICAAIAKVLDTPPPGLDVRKQVVACVRQKYAIDKMTGAYAELYNQLLARSPVEGS